LFEVIEYVSKADRSLVDWHHRNKSVKLALRAVGMDRRIQIILDKKTAELKQRICIVEEKFDETGRVFDEGVEAVSGLDRNLVRFSVSSVGETTRQAQAVCQQFDEDRDQTTEKISVQMHENDRLLEKSKEVEDILQNTGASRQIAESNRNNCSTVS
jgi:hypothetical protein